MIVGVGSGPSDLSSMVFVFRKKTTAEVGQSVINGVGVLIAAYHVLVPSYEKIEKGSGQKGHTTLSPRTVQCIPIR